MSSEAKNGKGLILRRRLVAAPPGPEPVVTPTPRLAEEWEPVSRSPDICSDYNDLIPRDVTTAYIETVERENDYEEHFSLGSVARRIRIDERQSFKVVGTGNMATTGDGFDSQLARALLDTEYRFHRAGVAERAREWCCAKGLNPVLPAAGDAVVLMMNEPVIVGRYHLQDNAGMVYYGWAEATNLWVRFDRNMFRVPCMRTILGSYLAAASPL